MEEGKMTNRSIAVLSIALVTALLAGCASNHAANDAARVGSAAASIPSGRWPLSGTWYGSGWEVGSSASIINGNATLRINDDGTWTMTGRPNGGAALEYSGTSTVNGNRWMSLALNGRRLYGPAMVNSRRVMLEFIRVE